MPRQRADPAPEARTPFVEIRLAVRQSLPPKPFQAWQGPKTPPVEGLNLHGTRMPEGVTLQWLLDVAWDWRGSNTTPEVEIDVCVPPESVLKEMEKVAPQTTALYRQEIAEIIEGNKRMKLTRTIAFIQRLIVDQYGKWEPRD